MVEEPRKPVSEAAARALAEAAERRRSYEQAEAELARKAEIAGPAGPDPVPTGTGSGRG